MNSLQIEKLILASTSPYRQQLLREVGVPFQAIAPEAVDESQINGSNPKETALLRAKAKAEAVCQQLLARGQKAFIVIGCDQVLDFAGQALGKACDQAEAVSRLRAMAGQRHALHNGLALLAVDAVGKKQDLSLDTTSVHLQMRNLSEAEIAAYIATGEWQGSAGAYKIEGKGQFLFERIEGLQADIIGLPLLKIFSILNQNGFNLLLHHF